MTAGEVATVFVIDDDEAVRHSLLFLLEVEGMTAHGFAGVDAFLAAPLTLTAGCIVTDLQMPGLNGADLLRVLPERGVGLPVIVITGHGDVVAAGRAMAAGAFDFIEKPFQDSTILGAVRAALARDRPDPERAARAGATAARIAGLAGPERRALDLLLQGADLTALATSLGIAQDETELMRARILQRLGARRLPDLVRLVTEVRRYADGTDGSR